ncbi:MAG: hypothetical protein EBS06_08655 [Proteobacteria bacterium]|nr:hypothetical protein [Pseudomonadota bacterium]
MIKKALILLGLIYLSGCTIVGFDKGTHYDQSTNFKRYKKNGNAALKIDKLVHVEFSSRQCGSYGLVGPLIFPIIPIWRNYDCESLDVGVSGASKVYLKHNSKIYVSTRFDPKSYFEYTFPISAKSLSDGAMLVVEKKDGEKFEIPFRYQHTFSFDLFPGR